jgi:hypothetical protein
MTCVRPRLRRPPEPSAFCEERRSLHRRGRLGSIRDRLRHEQWREHEHGRPRYCDRYLPAHAPRRRREPDRLRCLRRHRRLHRQR